MTVTATFDATRSRVEVDCTSGLAGAHVARVERSTDAGLTWAYVRGGTAVVSTDGLAFDNPLYDYEFTPDVANLYRVRSSILLDNFARTETAQWGTADTGQTWVRQVGTASHFSADGSAAVVSHSAAGVDHTMTIETAQQYATSYFQVQLPSLPVGSGATAIIDVYAQWKTTAGSDNYRLRCTVATSGVTSIQIAHGATVLGTTANFTWNVSKTYGMMINTSPDGFIRGKVWDVSGAQPDWQITTSDDVGPVPAGTKLGVLTIGLGVTNLPYVVKFPRFEAEAGDVTVQGPASVTPTLDAIWLKSIDNPALNRTIMVTDYTPPVRSSRSGLFEIVGSPDPVGINERMTSPSFTLEIRTSNLAAETLMDLTLAPGGVFLIHCPTGCRVPGGYVMVAGNASPERRTKGPKAVPRYWSIDFRNIRPPAADVVGLPEDES